jgi:Fur family transcriptional regulator, ferric uptake regulator
MDDDLHTAIAARLRRLGHRYTPGRRALVEALAGADRPLTTAELIAGPVGLPQSTTYRNLAVLEQAGVVYRVRGSDEFARFELSEELGGHHHHLVCVSCGGIEDFTPSSRFERSLADLAATATTSSGFQVQNHRLDLLGMCAACGAEPAR